MWSMTIWANSARTIQICLHEKDSTIAARMIAHLRNAGILVSAEFNG